MEEVTYVNLYEYSQHISMMHDYVIIYMDVNHDVES